MSTATATKDRRGGPVATTDDNAVAHLETLAAEYGPAAIASLSEMQQAVKVSRGIKLIRAAIQKLLPEIKELAGSPLGFKTDRDAKGGYEDPVLVEALTEATLRGVSWIGNQFNVIAGRCYITKEGYQSLVHNLDGLTDLNPVPGVPKMFDGGAVVPFKATWRLHGKAMSLERNIPVRLNNGMGVDGAIGKATRKMFASIHQRVTGSVYSEYDADDDDGDGFVNIAPAPVAVEMKSRLAAAVAPKAEPEADPVPAGNGKLFGDSGMLPD